MSLSGRPRSALIASHYSHLLDEDEKDDVLYTLAVKRLALGQFELACGALSKLAQIDAARARQFLLDIVENGAVNDWLQSPAVACDAQLRWLALAALRKLKLDVSLRIPLRLRRRIEFELLLHAAFARSASTVAELLVRFDRVNADNDDDDRNVDDTASSSSSSNSSDSDEANATTGAGDAPRSGVLSTALLADYVGDASADAETTPLSESARSQLKQLLVDSPVLARALALYTMRANDSLWHAAALDLARDSLAGANVSVLACAFPLLATDIVTIDANVDTVLRETVLLVNEGPLARPLDSQTAWQLERWSDQPAGATAPPRRTPWRSGSEAEQARATVLQALFACASPLLATRYAALERTYAQSMHAQHGSRQPPAYPLGMLLALDHAASREALLRQFWIAMHSTASANDISALELLLAECVKLVRARRLADASRMLEPVPQLRALAVLLAWDAADDNAQRQRELVEALCSGPHWHPHAAGDDDGAAPGAASPFALASRHAAELARRTRVAFWVANAVFHLLMSRAVAAGAVAQSIAVHLGGGAAISIRDADTLFVHLMTLANDHSLIALLQDYWADLDCDAALAVLGSDETAEAMRDAAMLRALHGTRLVHQAVGGSADAAVLDATFAKATRLLAGIASPRFRSEPLLALERMLLAGTGTVAAATTTAAASKPAAAAHSWLSHLVARPLDSDVSNRAVVPRPVAERIVQLLVACTDDGDDTTADVAWRSLRARAVNMQWRAAVIGRCGRITAPHTSAPRAMFGDQRPAHSDGDDASAAELLSPSFASLLLSTPLSLLTATLRAGAHDAAREVVEHYGTELAAYVPLVANSEHFAALRSVAGDANTSSAEFGQRLQACIDAVRSSAGVSNDEARGALLETELCIDAGLCASSGALCQLALERAKQVLARAAGAAPGSPHVAALARLLSRLGDLRQRATGTQTPLTPLLLDLRAFERRVSTTPTAAVSAATTPLRSAPALAAARAADESLARLHAVLLSSSDDDSESVEQAPALLGSARAFDALRACEADDDARASGAAAAAADSSLIGAYLARMCRHVLYLGDEVTPNDVAVAQRRYFALLMRTPAELLERVVFAQRSFELAATVSNELGVDVARVIVERLSVNRRVKLITLDALAAKAAADENASDDDDSISNANNNVSNKDNSDNGGGDERNIDAAVAAVAPPLAPIVRLAGVSARDVASAEHDARASLLFELSDDLASHIAKRSPLLATLACLLRAPLSRADTALAHRALQGVMARDEYAAFRRWVRRRTLAFETFVHVFGESSSDSLSSALLDVQMDAVGDEAQLLSRVASLTERAALLSGALGDESSSTSHAFAHAQRGGNASSVDEFYVAAAEQLVLDGDAARALRLLEMRLVAAAVPDFVLLVRLKRLADAEVGESWRLVRRVRDARRVVPYVMRQFERWPLAAAVQTVALLRGRVDGEHAAQLDDLLASLQLVDALVRTGALANVRRYSVLAASRPAATESDWCTLFVSLRTDPASLVQLALRCDAFALARELYTKLFVAAPDLLHTIERGRVRQLVSDGHQAEALDVLLAMSRGAALSVASTLLSDASLVLSEDGDVVSQLQVELFLTRFLMTAGAADGGQLFAPADALGASDFEFDDADDNDNDKSNHIASVPTVQNINKSVNIDSDDSPPPLSFDQLATLQRRALGLAALLCVPPSLATEHRALASRPLLLIECLLMLARTDAVAAIFAGVPELASAETDALAIGYTRRALRYDADNAATRARARHVALTVAARRPTRLVGGVRTLLVDDYDADVAHCLRGVLRAAEWRLTGDAAQDDASRARHFFAAAPSLSLARRLLALVDNRVEAARACIDAAEYLSSQLVRLPAAAVDAGEGADIVALMQRVLRHGKSLFVGVAERRARDSDLVDSAEAEATRAAASADGIALCDSLLSHTELLGQLHAAGCAPVEMSLKDFRNEARTRALRDALIGADDVELALEVATKCRLSTEPVFIAWGVALLELGDFAAARDKFSRCMSRPTDRPAIGGVVGGGGGGGGGGVGGSGGGIGDGSTMSSGSLPSVVRGASRGATAASTASETLNKIIQVLDLRPALPTIASLRQHHRELRDYVADKGGANYYDQMSVDAFLGAMHLQSTALDKDTLLPDANKKSKSSSASAAGASDASAAAAPPVPADAADRLAECISYVTQYGACPRVLEFLAARSLHKELVSFVLQAAVSPAAFVEHAVLPALSRVQLQSLLEAMREVDATLVSFSDYLLAVCKYFNHGRAWQLLLDVQVFMGDTARAALTCVRVFMASTSEEERLLWLERAKVQLERALAPDAVASAVVAAAAAAAAAGGAGASSAGSSPMHSRVNSMLALPPSGSPQSSSPPSSPRGSASGSSSMAGTKPLLTDAELSRYLRSVQLQMDVVRYLHAPARKKQVTDEQRQLTLFGSGRQKAALCEHLLVLGNFDLAFAIMQDFRLPTVRVYVGAINKLARSNLVGRVNDLLKDIRLMGIDERQFSEVVMAAIEIYAGELQRPEVAEKFIDKLADARHAVRAYGLVGNFRQAYIAAAGLDSVDEVFRVRNMASEAGAGSVVAMCDKFLVAHAAPTSTTVGIGTTSTAAAASRPQ